AVDRYLLARPYAQAITRRHQPEWNIFFITVRIDQSRLFRAEIEQSPDRGAGAAPGAQLHHLAKQDQRRDGGSRFVINLRIAVHAAHRGWENRRRNRCDRTVEIGHARAKTDQREHVRTAVYQRPPEALEERPSAPQDYGGGEKKLELRQSKGET